MKKVFIICFVLTLGLSGFNTVNAQDTLRMTLPEALQIAMSENLTLKIAGKEIQRQEYVRKETLGGLMPNLSAGGNYNRSIVKSTVDMGNGQKFSFEPTNTISGSASLSLPLFIPGVYSTLKLNEHQMEAAVETARASKITLVSEVKKAFYQVLMAEESLKVLIESEKTVAQTVDKTRVMFEQELSSEYDLITVQVQLSNYRPLILQAENAIRIAKQMLKMYLYIPMDIPIALNGSLSDFMTYNNTVSDFTNDNLSQNSDIKQLEIQERILAQQIKVSKTSRMPTLSAVGNFQVMGRNKISFGSAAGMGPETGPGTSEAFMSSNLITRSAQNGAATLPNTISTWETQTPLALGLQLSVPIFSGWSRTNKEKQIANSLEQVTLQRNYLTENMQVQARTAISNLLTAQSQMSANETTIAQATKGYDIARSRYFAGMGTILEVNNASLALTQALLNQSQTTFDFLSAQAEYNKILGHEF